MELCRRHIPSASLVETIAVQILVPIVPSYYIGEAVHELVLAKALVETVVRKIGADGCWR